MPNLREIPAGHIISCWAEMAEREQYKLFFLLAHHGESALCMKITSVLARYLANPKAAQGVAFCQAGEHERLKRRSAIETDNRFEIPYRQHGGDALADDHGPVSPQIIACVRTAITDSYTLSEADRRELLPLIDAIAPRCTG